MTKTDNSGHAWPLTTERRDELAPKVLVLAGDEWWLCVADDMVRPGLDGRLPPPGERKLEAAWLDDRSGGLICFKDEATLAIDVADLIRGVAAVEMLKAEADRLIDKTPGSVVASINVVAGFLARAGALRPGRPAARPARR